MRRNLLMLLALIAWSIWMLHSATFKVGDTNSIAGIAKAPGLAMEFARSGKEVNGLLGDPDSTGPAAQTAMDNRQIMKQQQYLDFVFIGLYWMFFVFVIAATVRKTVPWLGWLIFVLISIAAVADVLEDLRILSAVKIPPGTLYPFPFAVTKWFCFFVVLGLTSLLLLLYPRWGTFPRVLPEWSKWPRLLAGISFLAGSLFGVAAVIGAINRHGGLFKVAQVTLLVGFPSLLVLFVSGTALFQSLDATGSEGIKPHVRR